MNKEQIIAIIDELVLEYANKKYDDLKGKNLIDDLEYDSISLVELIAELEERLDISFEADMMLESVDNYESLVESVLEIVGNDVQ